MCPPKPRAGPAEPKGNEPAPASAGWEPCSRRLPWIKLAPIIVDGLKGYVAKKEAEEAQTRGFERILLAYQDADDNLIPKKKAFTGKWVISPEDPYDTAYENGIETDRYAVAVTAKNAVVMYYWTEDGEHFYGRHFKVFPSFTEAAADNDVKWAAIKAVQKIGVPVEELDI